MPWQWPYTRAEIVTIDPKPHTEKLGELRPRPAPLPPLAGERLVQTSADFAEIVLLYAVSRGLSMATPADVRTAAQKAVLWYYGLEAQ